MGHVNFIKNPLKRDEQKEYGKVIKDIFNRGCEIFDWDKKILNDELFQKTYFALSATSERYSVWFLVYSNMSESKGKTWYNVIEDDIIEEQWKKIPDEEFFSDDTTRLVFARNKNSEYVFLGVYEYCRIKKPNEYGCDVWGKIYRRISDTYPQ